MPICTKLKLYSFPPNRYQIEEINLIGRFFLSSSSSEIYYYLFPLQWCETFLYSWECNSINAFKRKKMNKQQNVYRNVCISHMALFTLNGFSRFRANKIGFFVCLEKTIGKNDWMERECDYRRKNSPHKTTYTYHHIKYW